MAEQPQVLVSNIRDVDSVIPLSGEPAPGRLIELRDGDGAETILVRGRLVGHSFDVVRGYNGSGRYWPAGTPWCYYGGGG